MSKRVLLVRHEDGSDDDLAHRFFASHGFDVQIRRPFQGEPLGEVTDDLAGAVIYGGRFNAYDADKDLFLRDEYRLIEACGNAGLPLLGFCQGAQMIAYQQGAWAGDPGHGNHEFGCYEVTPTPQGRDFLPAPQHFVQAHFHTFDLPQTARHLARSPLFEHQAFSIGDTTFGLQFHPEQTLQTFRRLQDFAKSKPLEPGMQTRETQDRLIAEHAQSQADWFNGFLAQLFGTDPY